MKILIADDDPTTSRMLKAMLARWGYDVIPASEGDEAWQILQQDDAPRLAILDWVMPKRNGIQICGDFRQLRDRPYTYILLLTVKGDRRDIVAGLEAGADDYLVKPFDAGELQARLRAGRRILELMEQLISARQQMQLQASLDPLTGIWNRRIILEKLEEELARARREESPLGLLMIDVDQFKGVNDQYGHLAGDAVLRTVVSRLRHTMRRYDTLGRYGGDEILMVAPGCNREHVAHLAERLRAAVCRLPVETPEGPIPVTVSVGCAAVRTEHDVTAEGLIRVTDCGLYRAKHQGRNSVSIISPDEFPHLVASAAPSPCLTPPNQDLLTPESLIISQEFKDRRQSRESDSGADP